MYIRYLFLLPLCALTTLPTFGKEAPGNIVTDWNATVLEAVRIAKPAPPVVARALAVAHTCMYDAWSAYDNDAFGVYSNTSGEAQRPHKERDTSNKQKAISFAAYVCAADLFPAQRTLLQSAMTSLGYDWREGDSAHPGVSSTMPIPAAIGRAAAAAVLSARHGDGANQLGNTLCLVALCSTSPTTAYADYTGFVPVNKGPTPIISVDPNFWQPLPNGAGFQRALTPHWGLVTPFSFNSPADFLAAHPIPHERLPKLYPSQGYADQVAATLALSRALGEDASGAMKATVLFWADGPNSYLPPGHWGQLAQAAAKAEKQKLDESVKMFFVMHAASMDAGIVSWHLKYSYNYVRPITAVRYTQLGQSVLAWGGPETPWDATINPNTGKAFGFNRYVAGGAWMPYNPTNNPNHPLTPAFPEYTSGHSIFSAASAKILTLFNEDTRFNHEATFDPYAPEWAIVLVEAPALVGKHTWRYPTYKSAANHAGWSRRFGGIHFEDGDVVSRDLGAKIADAAWDRAQWYFSGGRAEKQRCVVGTNCREKINKKWNEDPGQWIEVTPH